MTNPERLMAAGMPQAQAVQLAGNSLYGITTKGNSRTTGYVIVASNNYVSTCASAGVAYMVLPYAEAMTPVVIYNGGASPALVIAQSGETINALTSNATFSVTNGKSAVFFPAKQTTATPPAGLWIANLSA